MLYSMDTIPSIVMTSRMLTSMGSFVATTYNASGNQFLNGELVPISTIFVLKERRFRCAKRPLPISMGYQIRKSELFVSNMNKTSYSRETIEEDIGIDPKKVTPELVTLIKHHILKMLSGPNGSDYIKTDKNQGPDVNISKLHKSFLQQYEPEAIDPETDKVIKDYDAKVKSWLYFKVFHEEFKSMDFNTVKRKLSDLRKSLEASGALQATKKKASKQSRPRPRPHENQVARNAATNDASTSSGVAVSAAPTTQMGGYMGSQQPPPLHPNLQLSVLGLQHLGNNAHAGAAFNPAAAQQPQQQPLNLQTGGSGGQGGEQPQPQPLPLNLHSMGGHVPSYYLSLGHMSNLISLPVSSGGGVQTNTQTGNFPAQHNMQHFNPGTIIPSHSLSQTAPGPGGQPHLLQGGVGVTYTGPQHNHTMY
ncbi:hypothetical protein OTU49_009573 [Cherax quadricarinatus]|uniref:Uncharacterized protein n=1 Tax=Cherax quadricarinatus TaxID=27406 RepID=A0AAW0WAX5_CHEQU